MIQYTSQYQAQIDAFASLYQLRLNPKNRWIQLRRQSDILSTALGRHGEDICQGIQ